MAKTAEDQFMESLGTSLQGRSMFAGRIGDSLKFTIGDCEACGKPIGGGHAFFVEMLQSGLKLCWHQDCRKPL